jgi:hypothetical protein
MGARTPERTWLLATPFFSSTPHDLSRAEGEDLAEVSDGHSAEVEDDAVRRHLVLEGSYCRIVLGKPLKPLDFSPIRVLERSEEYFLSASVPRSFGDVLVFY